ncbi:MAG: PHP domain-containing protein [Fusobacteriaceae bacterium]
MKYKIDLHIHTNVNPHAYSTLEENIVSAQNKKMKVIAITNHGPALQDSPHWWSLANMCIIPEYMGELRILKGVEVNIIGENGEIDINQRVYDVMDIVIGGFHAVPEYGDTLDIKRNTRSLINLIKSQKVDILVHLGNPMFPIEYEEIVKCAKEHNVAIELNNGSIANSRKGSQGNCEKIAELASNYGCWLTLSSDSHFSREIGIFTYVEKIKDKFNFPERLLLNSSEEILNEFLEIRKKLSPKNII